MKTVGWNVLVLSFALFVSGEEAKQCSSPPSYPHTSLGQNYTQRQMFSIGEKVYYKCAEDFVSSKGRTVVQCLNHGQWSKLSLKCEKRSCGNAGELLNGEFVYAENSYIGERVYAVCKQGYRLKGLNYMTCKRTGWTGEVPTCEVAETNCSSPVVDNSVTSGKRASVYWVGDNVTFTCRQGFMLDGAQQVTCGPDGRWHPPSPRCLPSPQSLQTPTGVCGVPPAVCKSNAGLADKYITMTVFAHSAKVQYVCDVGYMAAGGSRYRTCKKGKWTPLYLKCERKVCGSAGEILNGQFTYTGVEFGDKATAECNEGYTLVGKATRNCMNNGWDGRVPECEAVTCADPPEVTNAVMTELLEEPYTYRSVVRYRCLVGTLFGDRELVCTADGTWSAPPPECKDTTCPNPDVPDASWRAPENGLYQYRETVQIVCNGGFALTGPSVVTCGSDGRWLPSLPTCSPKYVRKYSYNG